ncbi:MAG TPA: hypothetical protein VHG71_11540 [Verrucomicrobiae bacterium]|nr:hypothetical protein [Verrucomicrobiae bacterium]
MAKKLTVQEIDEQIKALQDQRREAIDEKLKEDREAIESLLIKAKDHYAKIHLAGGFGKVWTGGALAAAKAIGLVPKSETLGTPQPEGKTLRLRGEKKDKIVEFLATFVTKSMNRGTIQAAPEVVKACQDLGFEKVPNLAGPLKELVKKGTLKLVGERAAAHYKPA